MDLLRNMVKPVDLFFELLKVKNRTPTIKGNLLCLNTILKTE